MIYLYLFLYWFIAGIAETSLADGSHYNANEIIVNYGLGWVMVPARILIKIAR